jgi:hypothetical protein
MVALLADLLLQAALSLVRVGPGGADWLTPVLIARGRWVVVGALLWAIAPRLEAVSVDHPAEARAPVTWPRALRTAGVAMILLPVVWLAAIVVVRALTITLGGDWSIDGRVFVSSYFYSNLFIDYAPWTMAGATLFAIARHAPASGTS